MIARPGCGVPPGPRTRAKGEPHGEVAQSGRAKNMPTAAREGTACRHTIVTHRGHDFCRPFT
jgi:hypothetical protein